MFDKIKPEELSDGLKEAVSFATSKLSYEYFPPNESENKSIEIKPDFCEISLLGTVAENIDISNGGIESRNTYSHSSLRMGLSILKNIASSSSINIPDASIFSKDSLLRICKINLLQQFQNFANLHTSNKKCNNGYAYRSPKKVVEYIEEKPNVEYLSEKKISDLEKLSNTLYQMDRIFLNKISITNSLKIEIYIDKESKIIQYKKLITIVSTINYLNENNLIIPIDIVKHFQNNLPENFIEILLSETLIEIEKKRKFDYLKSGTYPILLKPSASDVFFHEALAAHMLSASFITENYSTVFKERRGELIPTLKGINLVMDPTLKDGFGSYKYDHEGVKSKKINLIEDGVISNFLTDRKSASYLEQDDKDNELCIQLSKIIKENPDILKKYVDNKYLERIFDNYKEQIEYLLKKNLLDELIENVYVNPRLNWRKNYKYLTNESNGHSRVEAWIGQSSEGLVQINSEARMSNLIIETINKATKDENLAEEMSQICNDNGLDFYLEIEAQAGEIDVETALFTIYPETVTKVYNNGDRKTITPGTFALNLEDFLKNIIKIGSVNKNNYGFCGSSSGSVPVGANVPEILVWDIPYQEAPKQEIAADVTMLILQYK